MIFIAGAKNNRYSFAVDDDRVPITTPDISLNDNDNESIDSLASSTDDPNNVFADQYAVRSPVRHRLSGDSDTASFVNNSPVVQSRQMI